MTRRGFSLIEVMIASAIFGVGLAAVFSSFSTAAVQFEHQRHTTYALHLAEARLEELLLRLPSDSELKLGTTFGPVWYDQRGFPSSSSCPTSTTGLPPASPECRYRVTWVSRAGGIAAIREVTVTAAWNEREAERSLALLTQRN